MQHCLGLQRAKLNLDNIKMVRCCTKNCLDHIKYPPPTINDKTSFILGHVKVFKCKSQISGIKQKSREHFRIFHLPGNDGQLFRVCKKAFMTVTKCSSETIHLTLKNAPICEDNNENSNTDEHRTIQYENIENVVADCQPAVKENVEILSSLPLFVEHYNVQISSSGPEIAPDRSVKSKAKKKEKQTTKVNNNFTSKTSYEDYKVHSNESYSGVTYSPKMSPLSPGSKSFSDTDQLSPLLEIIDADYPSPEDQTVPSESFDHKMPDILQSTLSSSLEIKSFSHLATGIVPQKFEKTSQDVTANSLPDEGSFKDMSHWVTPSKRSQLFSTKRPTAYKDTPHIPSNHGSLENILAEISANSYLHQPPDSLVDYHTSIFDKTNTNIPEICGKLHSVSQVPLICDQGISQFEKDSRTTDQNQALNQPVHGGTEPLTPQVHTKSVPESGRYIVLSGKRSLSPTSLLDQSHEAKRFFDGSNNNLHTNNSQACYGIPFDDQDMFKTDEGPTSESADLPLSSVLENAAPFTGSQEGLDLMSILSDTYSVDSDELYAKTSGLVNYIGVEREHYQQRHSNGQRKTNKENRMNKNEQKRTGRTVYRGSDLAGFVQTARRLYSDSEGQYLYEKKARQPLRETDLPDISKLSIKDRSNGTFDGNNAVSLPNISGLCASIDKPPAYDKASTDTLPAGWHTNSPPGQHNPVRYDARTDEVIIGPNPSRRISDTSVFGNSNFDGRTSDNMGRRSFKRSVRGLECTMRVYPRASSVSDIAPSQTRDAIVDPVGGDTNRVERVTPVERSKKKKTSSKFFCCFSGSQTTD